jgi:2-C-methyl-D-erythritol 4-phosphate cytidylyltransferase
MNKTKLGIVIAAGGSGSRFSKKVNKLLVEYKNKPLLIHSLETFLPVAPDNLVVAAPADLLTEMRSLVDDFLPGNKIKWTPGGATRLASVNKAANLLDNDTDLIAIHDAARPLADRQLLTELCNAALEYSGAIPGVAPVDTVKEVDENGIIVKNLIRKQLALVATPQVFDYPLYMQALEMLPEAVRSGVCEDPVLTDDAALFTAAGNPVKVVYHSGNNFKVTLACDINN